MASTGICAYCGAPISSSSQKCPHCGAANPLYVAPVRTASVTIDTGEGDGRPASTGTCPYCGGGNTWLQQGNEMNIKQIEVE